MYKDLLTLRSLLGFCILMEIIRISWIKPVFRQNTKKNTFFGILTEKSGEGLYVYLQRY